MSTFTLESYRLSAVRIVYRWMRGNSEHVGPLFYNEPKARQWMQQNVDTAVLKHRP